jgi:hypothetical protein
MYIFNRADPTTPPLTKFSRVYFDLSCALSAESVTYWIAACIVILAERRSIRALRCAAQLPCTLLYQKASLQVQEPHQDLYSCVWRHCSARVCRASVASASGFRGRSLAQNTLALRKDSLTFQNWLHTETYWLSVENWWSPIRAL